jgi:2-methylisocitrate lyase-like PEP mutase family enzyme
MPDMGVLNLTEIAAQTRSVTEAVEIPIWVDADTGYGNAVNTYHTVSTLANAGAAVVMIEDQEWPKRCGHMDGKSVINFGQACSKIEAAVAARDEVAPEMLVMARTDAAGPAGLDEAIRRLNAFSTRGADVVFADALLSREDIQRTSDEVTGAHLCVNMGFGIRERPTTPLLSAANLESMGVESVIYPRLITAAATMGMKQALETLRDGVASGTIRERPDQVVDWEYYMELVGQPEFMELERRFSSEE